MADCSTLEDARRALDVGGDFRRNDAECRGQELPADGTGRDLIQRLDFSLFTPVHEKDRSSSAMLPSRESVSVPVDVISLSRLLEPDDQAYPLTQVSTMPPASTPRACAALMSAVAVVATRLKSAKLSEPSPRRKIMRSRCGMAGTAIVTATAGTWATLGRHQRDWQQLSTTLRELFAGPIGLWACCMQCDL